MTVPGPALPAVRDRRIWLSGAAGLGLGLLLPGCQTPAILGGKPATPSTPGASAPAVAASVPVPRPTRPPRVGLALGGGAARGFAHIGVLQVLEEKGFKVDMVAGTSAGSLVAALFASGKDAKALSLLADQMDESKITDWVFPSRGLIKGEALSRYVNQQVGGRPLEQMRLPLGVVATDLASGEPIVFRRGDTGLAVRASATVPGVFQPVKIGNREYVDGGLVAPVPVRAVHEMGAEFVIAVDISSMPEGASTKGTSDVMLQTFTIMGKSINRHELKDADVVVRPNLPGVSSADFTARKKSIQAGRDAMLAAWPELQRKLAGKQIPL